jgi:hypothetical protein
LTTRYIQQMCSTPSVYNLNSSLHAHL